MCIPIGLALAAGAAATAVAAHQQVRMAKDVARDRKREARRAKRQAAQEQAWATRAERADLLTNLESRACTDRAALPVAGSLGGFGGRSFFA